MKHKKKVDAKCIFFLGLKNVLHIVLFSQQAQTFHFQRLIQRLNSSAYSPNLQQRSSSRGKRGL